MTHKLIKTDNYLLIVDDSEIKEEDWYHIPNGMFHYELIKKFNINDFNLDKEKTINQILESLRAKKIIAHLPLNDSPILEGVDLLPSIEDEVKILGINSFEGCDGCDKNDEIFYTNGYIKGYNKAKEKYKFTEEDVIRIVEKSRETGLTAEYLMLSIQQPKLPIGFKCEIKILRERPIDIRNHIYDKTYEIPKTTTNSQGQTEWVGEYIFN